MNGHPSGGPKKSTSLIANAIMFLTPGAPAPDFRWSSIQIFFLEDSPTFYKRGARKDRTKSERRNPTSSDPIIKGLVEFLSWNRVLVLKLTRDNPDGICCRKTTVPRTQTRRCTSVPRADGDRSIREHDTQYVRVEREPARRQLDQAGRCWFQGPRSCH